MRHKSKSSAQRPNGAGLVAPRFTWWHGLFFLLGLFVAGGIHVLFPSVSVGSFPLKSVTDRPPATAVPWGELRYTAVKLERPDESFPEQLPAPEPIQWVFQNYSEDQLKGLISGTDLKLEHKELLLDKTRWKTVPGGWQITPPLEVVREMSMASRKSLYSVLRQNPQNTFLENPARFDLAQFDGWVADCGLPPEKQELLRKLAIREGNAVYFYDAGVMEWLCSPTERKELAKAISQTPALMMKLHITPESDIDGLLRYWGRAGKGKAMSPLLNALDDIEEGVNLNVSFFFPAFARLRLYTYPDLNKDRWVGQQDCFWTALNFFNEAPDYKLMNHEDFVAKLKAEYVEVTRDFVFGDVMALIDGQRNVVHMCVYIADDVVFTKNGASPLAPWVLMKKDDMLKVYQPEQSVRIRMFRKKSMAA